MILVGDIGGTNTRLALAAAQPGGWRLEHLRRHATPSDLPALLREYLRDIGPHDALHGAAFCGAGPRRADGSIVLTNHPCALVPDALAAAVALPQVTVVNDFEAIAEAVPALARDDLRQAGGRTAGDAHAARLVLGPGTGLGVAGLIPATDHWLVLPGEGGHVDLAPVDDTEHAVWQTLRRTHGPPSAESLLSGSGLERLHAALHRETLTAATISARMHAGDAAAVRTVQVFTRWLGRVAANAALTLGASGGVYLAGGIVPGWGTRFDVATFRAGFEDKPGYREWLAAIPAWVITHPEPALVGLAQRAQRARYLLHRSA